MKLYVAKTLVEGIDSNSCSVQIFKDFESASKWADEEIDLYGQDYNGNVTERSPKYYAMNAGDVYVTIEVEEHII